MRLRSILLIAALYTSLGAADPELHLKIDRSETQTSQKASMASTQT